MASFCRRARLLAPASTPCFGSPLHAAHPHPLACPPLTAALTPTPSRLPLPFCFSVIERLGKFRTILKPGLNCCNPILDSARAFTWRKTYINTRGRIVDKTTNDIRIDLRESIFNFLKQEVYTKDTILMDVNAMMYYRIVDIHKAIYEVDDLQNAIQNVAQTQLKEVFGMMNFSDALNGQKKINSHCTRLFGPTFAKWGVHVERMELLSMAPRRATADQMKKQMLAERQRRGAFIIAEGKKTVMRLTSEGTKIVKINLGVAEQEATRKRSEGEAGAKVELAQAESRALNTVAEAITSDGASQTEYMISQRFMDLFRSMTQTVSGKTIYLPYMANGLYGLIAKLPAVYGMGASRKGGGGGRGGRKRDGDLD